MKRKNGIKLFIGGIAPETTSEALTEYFGQYSVILHVKVAYGRKFKLPKGFASVTIPDMKSVSKLLSKKHYIDGRYVDVMIAGQSSNNHQLKNKAKEVVCQTKILPISNLLTNETHKSERPVIAIGTYKGGRFNKFLNVNPVSRDEAPGSFCYWGVGPNSFVQHVSAIMISEGYILKADFQKKPFDLDPSSRHHPHARSPAKLSHNFKETSQHHNHSGDNIRLNPNNPVSYRTRQHE